MALKEMNKRDVIIWEQKRMEDPISVGASSDVPIGVWDAIEDDIDFSNNNNYLNVNDMDNGDGISMMMILTCKKREVQPMSLLLEVM